MGQWRRHRIWFQGGESCREGAADLQLLLLWGSLCQFCGQEIAENIFPRWWPLPGDQETIRAPEVSWSLSDKNRRSEDPRICLIFDTIHLPNSRAMEGRSLKFSAEDFWQFHSAKETKIRVWEKGPSEHSRDSIGNLGDLSLRARSKPGVYTATALTVNSA